MTVGGRCFVHELFLICACREEILDDGTGGACTTAWEGCMGAMMMTGESGRLSGLLLEDITFLADCLCG